MLDRDYRDIVAGVALALAGGASAIYALSHYSLGTFTRMGPGMVPTWLGGALAVFGIVIALQGLGQRGQGFTIRFRVLLMLGVSIVCFALMIDRFGMVPAVFTSALLATFAEAPVRPLRSLMLAVTLSVVTWAIFIAGLRLTIPSFDWPF